VLIVINDAELPAPVGPALDARALVPFYAAWMKKGHTSVVRKLSRLWGRFP
jgi:hypothetical protein